ncbi:hypothetical protein LTS18_012033, partial [Coniosporium uncinatum]
DYAAYSKAHGNLSGGAIAGIVVGVVVGVAVLAGLGFFLWRRRKGGGGTGGRKTVAAAPVADGRAGGAKGAEGMEKEASDSDEKAPLTTPRPSEGRGADGGVELQD